MADERYEQLEELVDRLTLNGLVEMLIDICHEKGARSANEDLSDAWEDDAELLTEIQPELSH